MKQTRRSTRLFLLGTFISLHLAFYSEGQTNVTLTLTPSSGQDAYFKSSTPTLNQGNYPDIAAMVPNNGNVVRSVFEFDMTSIPTSSTIIDARLSLYFSPTSINGTHAGNGANHSTLYRITDAWNQNTVTWDTQPGYSMVNAVNLPATTTSTENFTQIDVTQLVQDMVNDPSNSHGFFFKLDVENQVRKLIFASSDHADGSLRPTLDISYCSSFVVSDEPMVMPDITICNGDTTFLDIISGNLNDASDWHWYADNCGGAPIGNGLSIQVSPASTTTYYARGEGVCVSDGPCDSVVVTVSPLPTITENGGVLSCSVSGASYQWIDCTDNSVISGETSQNFTPANNGEFAVISSISGCTDTSVCFVYNSTSLKDFYSDLFVVSPNPVADKLHINVPNKGSYEVILYSLSGAVQHQTISNQIETVIDVSRLENGVYFVAMKNEGYIVARKKIVVNH